MTNDTNSPTCPRCTEPRNPFIGTAMSRSTPDRDIEICGPCGSDEAMREHHTGRVIPVAEWPVHGAHAFSPRWA